MNKLSSNIVVYCKGVTYADLTFTRGWFLDKSSMTGKLFYLQSIVVLKNRTRSS